MKTSVVRDNAFNPVWNETLHLPFDCVGGMLDLIFVKFTVRQEGKDDEDDDPIAIYCVPLGSLNQGTCARSLFHCCRFFLPFGSGNHPFGV